MTILVSPEHVRFATVPQGLRPQTIVIRPSIQATMRLPTRYLAKIAEGRPCTDAPLVRSLFGPMARLASIPISVVTPVGVTPFILVNIVLITITLIARINLESST